MIPKDQFVHHLHAERRHHPAKLFGIPDTAEEKRPFPTNIGKRHRLRCTHQCFGRESRGDGIDRGTQGLLDRIQDGSNHGFIFNSSQNDIRGSFGFAKRFPQVSHGQQRLHSGRIGTVHQEQIHVTVEA